MTWQLIEEMAVKGAELLLPVFEREGGRKGRLSIQTNPSSTATPARITEQAIRFAALAPNMQVKVPVTRAGVAAIEEMTAAGDQRQRDRLLHGAAGARGRRGGRARSPAARGGRRGRDLVDAGLHDHGRPTRRLASGARRRARGSCSPPAPSTGSGIACLKRAYAHLPGAWLPGATARRGLQAPPPLVGADRRRCRADDPLQVAAAIQRLERRGRRRGSSTPCRQASSRSSTSACRTSAAPTSPTASPSTSSTTTAPRCRTLRQFIGSYQDLVAVIRDFMLPSPG